MNDNFINYARSVVGLGDALIARVEGYYEQCQSLIIEPIEDIIVNDIIQQDGARLFDTLYFFTKGLAFEIVNFVSDPTIWIAPLKSLNDGWVQIIQTDFDLKEAKPTSRISVVITWPGGLGGSMSPKASGQNCVHVIDVLKRHVLCMLSNHPSGS
jgi:hypothetical protein